MVIGMEEHALPSMIFLEVVADGHKRVGARHTGVLSCLFFQEIC